MSTKIHIILDDDLAARLKALAKEQDRAFSRQIAYMLRQALEYHDPTGPVAMPFTPGVPPAFTGRDENLDGPEPVEPSPMKSEPPGGHQWYEPQ